MIVYYALENKLQELLFDCDDVGDMNEYFGCKIEQSKEGAFRLTQPITIQSFEDKFDLPSLDPVTPGEPGHTLKKAEADEPLTKEDTKYYCKEIGKLLLMMRWSRPDIYNSVRDCLRHICRVAKQHIRAMHRTMKYVVSSTANRGWLLRPKRKWDRRDKDFEFIINGMSDSDYAACKRTRKRRVQVCGHAGRGGMVESNNDHKVTSEMCP